MTVQAFRDAAYPQETSEAFYYLIVIEQDELDDPIPLTDGAGTYDETLDCYILTVGAIDYFSDIPFVIDPPGQSDEQPTGKLTVPNIDQRIGSAIESIHGPATVTVTAVLASDPTVIVGGPYEQLLLQNVHGDALSISGDLTWPQLTVEPWPKGRIDVRFNAVTRTIG